MNTPATSSHKGRNIAFGVIIGAVVVILLIVLVRAVVEKRRDDARVSSRTGTVARTTRTGATGSSAGASASSANASAAPGGQSGADSSAADGNAEDGAAPPADQPADGSDGSGQPSDDGPISFTPLHIESFSITPSPVPFGGMMYCQAQIRGSAAGVTLRIDGPPNEDYLFNLRANGTEGDVTTWTYSQNSPHTQGAYRYQVTATAADGTSITSDWSDFIVAAQ